MKMAFTIINLLVCLALIAVIVKQSGKSAGLSGALGGSTDTFLAKNRGKSLDSRLALATKWIASIFIVLTIVLNLM